MQLPPHEPIHITVDTPIPSIITTPYVVPQRSQRERLSPSHLYNYHYSNTIMLPLRSLSSQRGTHHLLSNFFYDHLYSFHCYFIINLFVHSEPKFFS